MCLGILQNDGCVFPYGESKKKSRKRKPPWAGQAQREQAMQALDESLEYTPLTTSESDGTQYLTPASAILQTIEHRGYDCRHGIVSSSLPICIPVREAAVRYVMVFSYMTIWNASSFRVSPRIYMQGMAEPET
jgi:hypothetical protein